MDTENVVVTKQDRKYKTLVTDIGKEKMTNAILNGKKVNVPSYLVKAGDVIEVAESSRSSEVFKRLMGQDAPVFVVPTWMERDKNSLKGTVVRLPAREEIDVPVEEHLIVELYSK